MVPDRGIFVVADGMGGHAAGEVASEMAVRFVARELGSLKSLSDDQVADRMRTSRSEEHTSELQSRSDLVCRLLLEKKKNNSMEKMWNTYIAVPSIHKKAI